MPDVTVSSVNASSNAWATQGGNDLAGLTPDGLLAYCNAQLNDMDGQINGYMNGQKAALRDRTAVQSAEEVFKKFGTKGPQNQDQWDECEHALDRAANSLPADDPNRQALIDYKANLEQQYCRDISRNPHYPGDGEWQANTEALDNMASGIKSGAEIEMIKLQSLVSQRATVVQLTTNMMSKMDQSLENVASKI
jgi:hypothetical protein